MIKLTVQHYNGAPLPQPLSAQFDEMGGTIGRADNNHLVLPDPERSISRVHAQVVFRHGSYAVIDRGSNPIQHNGRLLGNGEEALLNGGDQIEIGGYLISVEQSASTASSTGSMAGQPVKGSADPFADFGGVSFASAAPAQAPAFSAPASPAPAVGGIPDDWNPFAPTPAPASTASSVDPFANLAPAFAQPVSAPAQLIPDMVDLSGGQANTSSSLDAMFGLGAPTGADPFAASSLAAPVHAPNTSGHVDPMQALFGTPEVVAAPVADHVSSLHEPFLPPAIDLPVAGPTGSQPPLEPIAAVPATASSQGPVFSWDDGAQEGRTVIRAKASSASKVVPQPESLPSSVDLIGAETVMRPSVSAPPPAQTPMPTPLPTPQATQAGVSTPAAGDAALLAALASGLGISLPAGQQLTPEFMQLLGQMLRDATQGTVDLLVARAALKREVRAEVTMIAAKENNPLKFSPSAEVALNHLLSPPVRGFMPSSMAMRDAYHDLRAHQFAFVAGMRAALEGVLLRFDPAQLEGKLTQKSGLSGLLAGSRKARMWELFVELYGQISAEASDDFHELFGKAFLQAYESHLDQLDQER